MPNVQLTLLRDVLQLVAKKGKGLLGLHAFSGADWGGKFAGVSKSRWVKQYLGLESECDIVHAFQIVGRG